ncbi:hypothetical protein [Streptomyces sp. Isolate_219]|uniref:hypothetical protein n=1 Tax=Streptomyces sp. Isolate_219 TaxID=2950110 RepID=UPI0021C9875F|nr:hypothetical protein [Streptomyces sp. Isolate_219]MCR8578177.1 hypothetical protein [Streptomyces sp. Isolate_219]
MISAYLGAHGPATPAAFDAWLLRGATRGAGRIRGVWAGVACAVSWAVSRKMPRAPA